MWRFHYNIGFVFKVYNSVNDNTDSFTILLNISPTNIIFPRLSWDLSGADCQPVRLGKARGENGPTGGAERIRFEAPTIEKSGT